MDYLHREFDLQTDDVVEVTLDSRANVVLLDDPNFAQYRAGAVYRYRGGYAETSPVRLAPPRPGKWHLVVDLGGYAGSVRAGVRVLHGSEALQPSAQ